MAPQLAYRSSSVAMRYLAFILRLALRLLVLGAVLILALIGVGGVLTYHVVTRQNTQEDVNPQSYLLSSYLPINFVDSSGGEHEGWLLLGLRRAPVIILAHGYDSNRSELLSMGAILRDNHFNVYIFNFQGPKVKERFSDLGPRQASELKAAIESVTRQPEVNSKRVGLFGTSVGAYAALVAASADSRVKAIAVDSAYVTPDQMFDLQVDDLLGSSSRFFRLLTETEFHLATGARRYDPLLVNLPKLAGTPKLFIAGRDAPSLAEWTETIYKDAPPPKQLLALEHGLAGLTAVDEKKEYAEQVLNYFLQNLSLRAD